MSAKRAGLAIAGVLLLAGCASTNVTNKDKDTLNERSDRMAALEDRLPPNPNRPADNREQKASATVIQKDAALEKEPINREDKGLAVNAGPDQHVRPQDPTLTPEAPKAAGGPAARQQETVASADSALAARVKETLLKLRKGEANTDPALASKESQGEKKAVQEFEVTAKNGVVTLSGPVPTDADRTAWEHAASRVAGVTSVKNYLTVAKPGKS